MKKLIRLLLFPALFFTANQAAAQTQITFYTTMGTFVAQMYDTLQPITAGNFISLVDTQFYDGIIFHRVVQGFVIQGGDPTGTGSGGPGYTIPDEFDPMTHNVQKALGMANSGPNTGGSQFFINLVNNLNLDANYPVFGIVTSGFPVVLNIGAVPVNANDRPLTPVVMDSVRITTPVTSRDYFSGEVPLIEIYPNPVNERTVFRIKTQSHGEGKITIWNQLGMPVFERSLMLNGGEMELNEINVASLGLAPGIYYFSLHDGERVGQRKFVVVE